MWQSLILILLFALNAVVVTKRVGKPRKPITKAEAGVTVVVDAILILLVITI